MERITYRGVSLFVLFTKCYYSNLIKDDEIGGWGWGWGGCGTYLEERKRAALWWGKLIDRNWKT
jgi:hypothetical protein